MFYHANPLCESPNLAMEAATNHSPVLFIEDGLTQRFSKSRYHRIKNYGYL
jgi:hypothetical protein